MITLVEALNYRCLRYVSQPLGGFHVLVGPNASGKSTFLDVLGFLRDLVVLGPEAALRERSANFEDLTWAKSGTSFELAIEARLPDEIRAKLGGDTDTIRYEVAIGIDQGTQEVGILAERGLLRTYAPPVLTQVDMFPASRQAPTTLEMPKGKSGQRTVFSKVRGGNDNFYSEVAEAAGKGWFPSIRLGPRRSALASVPADESKFPAALWLQEKLARGVQPLVLNSALIRRASPPGQTKGFRPDGSNLPWVMDELRLRGGDRFNEWVAHVQTALPDIESVRVVERDDDRHKYLMLRYRGGLEIPSWVASDGTLRLLALTLPAYLPELRDIYLVEEPENGIHPSAVETIFQSLSSVYDAQVLLASHSPVMLNLAEPAAVLCFAKDGEGATDIVSGDAHPALREWKRQVGLGTLLASGVLG